MRFSRMMRALVILTAVCLAALSFAALAEEDWICPGCGRANPDRANFCGECRTPKPTTRVDVQAQSNAWICEACGIACPDGDQFCMICGADRPANERRALLIDPVVLNPVSWPAAQILVYNDSVSEKEVNTFSYTAPEDGVYSIRMSEMNASMTVYVSVLDSLGEQVDYGYLDNGEYVSFSLTGGETYTIRTEQNYGTGSYTLNLGVCNPRRDVTEYQHISDSLVFDEQRNVYDFTAPCDGRYTFTMKELVSGLTCYVDVTDRLDFRKEYGYLENGESFSVDLEAGERYAVAVEQHYDKGSYLLEIGCARPVTDISGLSAVGDEVYFAGQQIDYACTAPENGRYTLTVNTGRDTTLYVCVYDQGGYQLGYGYLDNGEDFSVDLEAGGAYVIRVEQQYGFDAYTLSVNH